MPQFWAVVGGGFGIYGHLQALVDAGKHVATLEKYRSFMEKRPDLQHLIEKTIFFQSEDQLIASANHLICARRPVDNIALVDKILGQHLPMDKIILEKPPAPSLQEAVRVKQELLEREISCFVPLIFCYCGWYKLIEDKLDQDDPDIEIRIRWRHSPMPDQKSWKYLAENGGGILLFYLSHFFPIIAKLKRTFDETEISFSSDDQSLVLKMNQAGVSFEVDFSFADMERQFQFFLNGVVVYNFSSPFSDMTKAHMQDLRVPYLRKFYRDVQIGAAPTYASLVSDWAYLHSSGLFALT